MWLNSTVEIISAGGRKRKKADFRLLPQHEGTGNIRHSTKNATNEGFEGIQMNSLMQTGCMPLHSNETSANIKKANFCFQHICSLGEEKLSGEDMLQEEPSLVAIKLFVSTGKEQNWPPAIHSSKDQYNISSLACIIYSTTFLVNITP